jgi:hypothetical protein
MLGDADSARKAHLRDPFAALSGAPDLPVSMT